MNITVFLPRFAVRWFERYKVEHLKSTSQLGREAILEILKNQYPEFRRELKDRRQEEKAADQRKVIIENAKEELE